MNKPELTIDYEYQDNDKIHLWVTVTFAEGEEPPSGILKLAVESTNPSREIKAAETYGDRCEFDFNIVPDEVADYLATASWRANKPEELNNFAGPEDASQTSLAPSDSASEEILSGGNRTQLSIHVWNAAEALAPHYAYNLAVSGGAGPKKEAFLNDLCFTLTANSGFVIDAIEAAVLTYSIMGSPVAHAKPLASEMIGVVKFDTLEGAAISFGPTTLSFTAKVQTRQAGENRVRKLPFTLETA